MRRMRIEKLIGSKSITIISISRVEVVVSTILSVKLCLLA
jgi:hypothetical protein